MQKNIFLIIFSLILYCGSAMAAGEAPPTTRAKLSNDAQLISTPNRMAPVVSMTVLVHAGAADETAASAGWRQLLASAMIRAIKKDDATLQGKTLQEVEEAIGGHVAVRVLDDSIAFTAVGQSSSQLKLAQLLLAVVQHPRLSEQDLAASRRQMLRNLSSASRQSVPNHSQATEALQSLLYQSSKGEAVAYGLNPQGSLKTLTNLSDHIVRKLYQEYFYAANMTVSLSGDVDEPGLVKVFEQMPHSTRQNPTVAPQYRFLQTPPSQTIRMRTGSPWVLVGFRINPQAAKTPQSLAALQVLTEALGNLSPSLLSVPLDKKELAQNISGQLLVREFDSELMLAVQCNPQKQDQARDAVMDVINRIRGKPLPKAIIQKAILYAQGQWANTHLSLSTRNVLSGYAVQQQTATDRNRYYDLAAVTAKDVQAAARQYLIQYAVVTVLPG